MHKEVGGPWLLEKPESSAGLIRQRTLSIPVSRYGLESNERQDWKETIVPVHFEGREALVRVMSREIGEEGPRRTLLMVGGGASESLSNLWMAMRFGEALKSLGNNDRFQLLVLPHPASSPASKRERRRVFRKKEVKRSDGKSVPSLGAGWGESAGLLKKALDLGSFKLSEEILVWGYSNGSAQLISLSKKFDGRVRVLVASDSSGLQENPEILKKVARDPLNQVLIVGKKKGIGAGIDRLDEEMGVSWATPKGLKGSPFGLGVIGEMMGCFSVLGKDIKKLAKEWGLKDDLRGRDAKDDPTVVGASSDSTKEARDELKGKVMYTVAGESLVARLGDELGEDLNSILKDLFPRAESVCSYTHPEGGHSALLKDPEYWREAVKKFLEFI